MEESEAKNSNSGFAAVVQFVTFVAIVLPAIGFISRYIAIVYIPRAEIPGIASIASGESIATLTAIGAEWTFLPALFGLAVVWAIYKGRERIRTSLSRLTKRTQRTVLLLCVIFLLGSLALLIAFAPAADIFAFLGGCIAGLEVGSFPIEEPLSIKNLWVVLVTLSLVAVLSGGLFQTQLPTGHVTFSAMSLVKDGNYVVLGSNSSETFLLPCNPKEPMLSVNSEQIYGITYFRPVHPKSSVGLVRLFSEGGPSPFGAGFACPKH